ncbi:MAG: prenyltransferase/squalene oxidase repeat-containing protein [Promethearchaeota archaeon]
MTLKNSDSLIEFLEKNASPRDVLRLHSAMGDDSAKVELFNQYRELQLPSGAFSFRFWKGNPPSLMHSYRAYHLLKELEDVKLTHESIIKLELFLENSQRTNGSWIEDNRLLEIPDLPPWMNPKNKNTEILTTAYCCTIMIIEDPSSMVTQKALKYLNEYRNYDGSFMGFPHTTWIAGAAFLGYYGTFNVTGREMISVIDDLLDQSHPGSIIQWITSSLLLFGFKPQTLPVLSRALDLLEKSQQSDGFWSSEDEGRQIETTVDCLITLHKAQRINW